MSMPAQAREQGSEREFLEGLRTRYEAEGFTFTIEPDRSVLPPFLGSYMPDALAQKPGRNIAIEVKSNQSPGVQARLQDIRRLFAGQPEWQFNAAFIGSDPLQSMIISKASATDVRNRVAEVLALLKQGHQRPAFIMAWSLLEAALQAVDDQSDGRPRTLGTVVQALSMLGYIDPKTENRMRALIQLRNRIVHGDLEAEPSRKDVELVISAVEETLADGTN